MTPSAINLHRNVCDCMSTGPVLTPGSFICESCGKTTNVRHLSPTKIALVAVPDFCPRCYSILLELHFKKPFDFGTPAVMQHLDKHQKRLAKAYLKEGVLPKFFGAFKDAKAVLPIEKLSCFHAESMLQLYGLPDLVFGFDDGTAGILDDKTANVKSEDHPLYHMYRAQLSLYKYMLEHEANPRAVSKLGILYYEFSRLDDDEDMIQSATDDEIWTCFKPKYVDVDVSGANKLVNSLLRTVRSLLDMDELPAGKPGCRDCEVLALYAPFLEEAKSVDRAVAQRMGKREYDRLVARRRWLEFCDHNALRPYLANGLKAAAVNPYGVLANWNFVDQ